MIGQWRVDRKWSGRAVRVAGSGKVLEPGFKLRMPVLQRFCMSVSLQNSGLRTEWSQDCVYHLTADRTVASQSPSTWHENLPSFASWVESHGGVQWGVIKTRLHLPFDFPFCFELLLRGKERWRLAALYQLIYPQQDYWEVSIHTSSEPPFLSFFFCL